MKNINIDKMWTGIRYKYVATYDGYDGAPIDNETPSEDPIGVGDNEAEAIQDLFDND